MVHGTHEIDVALDNIARTFEMTKSDEWAVNYARGNSYGFGARVAAVTEESDLKRFLSDVNDSTRESHENIEKLIDIQIMITRIIEHYAALESIGYAWISSVGQEILNRTQDIVYYQ